MISLEDVRTAAGRIDGVVHRTPVVSSRSLDEATGLTVFCKAENLQRAGSFKLRGAYNRISSLDPAVRERGVVAYSSGNHAQAVALAAQLLGIPATIVMPEDAPRAKRDATAGYGAEIRTYDRATGDRVAIATDIAEELGRTVIPPYEDPVVMAGAGTTAYELIEEAGPLDALLVPVGGGGLIAGCATAAKGMLPEIRVLGVEPDTADDTRRSLEAGHRVRIDPPRTIADGLQATEPGELTFEVNQRSLDGVVAVSDAEMIQAIRFAVDRMKLVLEPSGSVALAALLQGRAELERGARVGIVLSGGNVGATRLGRLLGDDHP